MTDGEPAARPGIPPNCASPAVASSAGISPVRKQLRDASPSSEDTRIPRELTQALGSAVMDSSKSR
eukprot:4074953-Pyramimonas_sp.AAC.1